MYPTVTLQVVNDVTESRVFRDNSSNTERQYESRTVTGISSSGSLVSISIPERSSASIPHKNPSEQCVFSCSRIEVVRGIWQCVAVGLV